MRKRLYRSRTDRMLFGVAGGFADWLDVDPAVVRIVWALLVLAAGTGFLLYIVAAIVIPEEPFPGAASAEAGAAGAPDAASGTPQPNASSWTASPTRPHDSNGALIFGGLLVLIGLWFFAKDLLPNFDDRLVLPGLLVVLGAVLVLGSMRRR